MHNHFTCFQSSLAKATARFSIGMLLVLIQLSVAAQQKDWMVRVAKLEIDSAYLPQYRAAVEEHTKAAIANEPGVLTLYAMYEKDHPSRVMVLEIYANKEAYQLHIKTPHFIKYKTGTKDMVKSLELVATVPLIPGMRIK